MINEYRLAHDVDEVLGTHTSTASPARPPRRGASHPHVPTMAVAVMDTLSDANNGDGPRRP